MVMIMREIKVVAYGTGDEDDSKLIGALIDNGMDADRITIYTVDPLNETIREQGREISDLRARVAELEVTEVDREPSG